jgi:GDP-L-fucose synthase
MKTVLITGSSGLVGSAIKSVAKNYNYHFVYLDSKICNLTDYNQTLSTFTLAKPDIIIHLAAYVGGLFKNMNEKVKMFEDNILINTNVVKAAYHSGAETLVACLSTCVFPDDIGILNETCLHKGPPHDSNEGYAYAKRMLEVQCRLYRQQFNKRYFCIIPTNIYGPNDNFNLEDSHVIPAFIHKCYLAKQKGLKFEVRGTGKPLRQFIFSIDLAILIIELLSTTFCDNIVLADSKEYSILEVAKTINHHFGNEITINESYSDGQYRKTADTSVLNNLIDFKFTDFEEGIRITVDWFIKNYKSLTRK